MPVASPNEPLILADGTKINPATGKVLKDTKIRGGFIEVPNALEAQTIVAKARRSIKELPIPGKSMNAVSLVLFYSMWGLADQDIAIVTELTVPQVKNIKKLPEYAKLSQDIMNNVLEHEANDIRTFMQQNAKFAAEKIVHIAQEEDGALGFKASQDILDRAGFRPADVVEHRHKMEDSLKIEFVKREAPKDLPQLTTEYTDAEFEEVEED